VKLLGLLFLIQFSTISCELNDIQNPEGMAVAYELRADESFVGEDIDGETRRCVESSQFTCTEIFTEEDQYGLDCLRDGDIAIQCGCHDWICISEDPFDIDKHGFDINGDPKSCVPVNLKSNNDFIACTMDFNPEDQFGTDCEAAGHEAIKCGCHDWLCVEKIENNI
jgi:hypothetical protein